MPNQANTTRQKSYRPARRPPAYLRTKSGCLTCRKRKKKCDEQRNTCGNCARRWIECVWPLPTASGSPKVDRRSSLVSSTDGELARLPSEPEDALESLSAGSSGSASPLCFNIELAAGSETPLRLIRGPSMMKTYLGEVTHTDSHIFDLLQTKWLRQLIRPLASDAVIELYYRESMVTAMSTPFFMRSLLACCAFEYPAHDAYSQGYFQRLAETLYVQAVAGLRQFLELKGPMVLTSAVSRTVLMLCIFERTRPLPSSGVVTHLSGLARLVHNTEAIEATSDEALSPQEKLMRRVTLEAFIFHSTTSIPFQPRLDQEPNVELALGLAERALQDLCSYDTPEQPESPVLGATPKLFLMIREISLMHLKHEQHDPARYLHLISEIEAIEEELAASRHPVSNEYPNMDRTVPATHHSTVLYAETPCVTDTFLFGPKFYVIAAKILLTDMSKRYNQAPVYDMHELRREGLWFVRQLQPSVDYYAEYYSWPIQVLARFVSCQQDRDLLLTKVEEFWQETRCGTMRRIADILTADNDKPSLCG